jgi:isopentenyl diphosphate isomerase/L-lactate dehydrogenase-like FMN-dependent dehydrogenase
MEGACVADFECRRPRDARAGGASAVLVELPLLVGLASGGEQGTQRELELLGD